MSYKKLKKGSQTGLIDSNFKGIRIGDRVRNIETGIVGRVDPWGGVCLPGRQRVGKHDFKPSEWSIIEELPEVQKKRMTIPEVALWLDMEKKRADSADNNSLSVTERQFLRGRISLINDLLKLI